MSEVTRLTRRLVGLFRRRVPEMRLSEVPDHRAKKGQRWDLSTLLLAPLLGICAGCKSLSEVEALTEKLPLALRREFQIARRVPDTTMRDALDELPSDGLRHVLHRSIKAAQRRKALQPTLFPMGVVVMDGKETTATSWDNDIAQRQRHSNDEGARGAVRTVTACLVSSAGKPCLDAIPIPPHTNEMGHFPAALDALLNAYGTALFEIVGYDSGATSLHNADYIVSKELAYLLALKDNQPTLVAEARRLLGDRADDEADAVSVDILGKRTVTRRLYRTEEMASFMDWNHLRTTVRVQSVTTDEHGKVVAQEDRYFISSLPMLRFSPDEWLRLIRLHWGVENNCHNTWDKIFREDDRPFILSPKGMLAVLLLRRIAYNLLTLYRSVTQRSDEKRAVPWKTLLQDVYDMLLRARPEHLEGLRVVSAVLV